MSRTRTAQDFLADLRKRDKTVADWCREHGFSQASCYRVLAGKGVGRWGETRRIARAMGLTLPDQQKVAA